VTAVLAVDFGASSVRVCRVELDAVPLRADVVHRCAHAPVRDGDGSLRWDWPRLVDAMARGLEAGCAAGPVASIGVDTWGVDYGLLDERGTLIAPPFSYRDARTAGYRAVVDRIGEARLYELTGLQLEPYNTIFQLAAHRRDELERAHSVLLLPELLVHHLTGAVTAEPTSAGTSGLRDITTGSWSDELCAVAGIERALLPELLPATTPVGTWRDIPVHLVGGHDTASAVVAMGAPPGAGTAFVSSGTWLIVGRELARADTSETARRANFSNETGALGGIRHLRNVAGFWLLERCRAEWGSPSLAELVDEADAYDGDVPTFDATDERLLDPPAMVAEITDAAGLAHGASRAVVVATILDSMAATVTDVFERLGGVTDARLFGGGAQLPSFVRRLGAASRIPITTGPVEAAALGNAMVQGIALGVYADVSDARAALALVSA